jgi:haloalkane dehalogenase
MAFRTPDERFTDLPDFPFEPHYLELAGDLRMHYVDEGPRDGRPVLMLHGEPTWSYLYRHMVPVFAEAGYRALAPDLIGFGRSDKPEERSAHTYARHVAWVAGWIEALDLRGITLVCQDWGSLIGLRLVGEMGDRFSRVVVANGFLPTAEHRANTAFRIWRAFAQHSPVFPIGRIVATGTKRSLTRQEKGAYEAPFPTRGSMTGPRAMPHLVPITPGDPAMPANRAAWASLGLWAKPFLTLFGENDPILGRADGPLQRHVPGAAGQPHARLAGGHFVQEDAGVEIAERTVAWIDGLHQR